MRIDRAVITRSFKYNGSMFDAFEYFYRLWELDKNVKFVSEFPHINKDFLSIKYNVDIRCFENFIYANPYNFKYNKVLIFDAYNFLEPLNAEEIFNIKNHSDLLKGNVKYFSEYSGNKNYINKIYYQIIRKFEHAKNVYINSMDANSLEFLKLKRKYPNAIIKDYNSNFQVFSNTKGFLPDIYKYFDEYYYIKTKRTFDRHPRMFTECEYLGIKCHFISECNPYLNNDNAYKRFLDRYDFEKRFIFNDEVINLILK